MQLPITAILNSAELLNNLIYYYVFLFFNVLIFFQDLLWISWGQVVNIKGVLMKCEHPQRLLSAQIGGKIKI